MVLLLPPQRMVVQEWPLAKCELRQRLGCLLVLSHDCYCWHWH